MSDWRTVLVSDIVGSTTLHDRHGDAAMAELWVSHDRGARDLIRRWRGLEIGRSDGIIAMFDGNAEALGFAHDYHCLLAALPVPARARVGIHAGPVELRENAAEDRALGAPRYEVDALVLPLAVRVMGLAAGGQTLLTAAALPRDGNGYVALFPLGHWRLRGAREPLELFDHVPRDGHPRWPGDAAAGHRVVQREGQWWPVADLPHRLPVEHDRFVGRGGLLAKLRQRFDEARLVTLTGPGGVGKTRLACRHARLSLAAYPGGAWFCDLANAGDGPSVLQAVAAGLDLSIGARAEAPEAIGDSLAARGACLLVVDNAEQVRDAVAELLPRWLAQAPRLHVLVTSRLALHLPGEWLVDVPPLPQADATALFADRARAAGAALGGAASDLAIAELVVLVDGLPLALELAAARTRAMPPAQIVRRLASGRQTLSHPAQGGGRHDALRATIDWSWRLLTPQEQKALAQCSVFGGGFELDAANGVLAWPAGVDAAAILQRLVDHSLLRVDANGRYRLLRLVREFAAERLHARVGASDLAARHMRWFASLPEAAVEDDGAAVELEDLVEACRHAVHRREAKVALDALALAAARLQVVGPVRRVLTLAAEVQPLIEAVEAEGQVAGHSLRAELDRATGNAWAALGQPDDAARDYARGLGAAMKAGLSRPAARLLCASADLALRQGHADRAREYLDQATGLAAREPAADLSCTLANLAGQIAMAAGRWTDAGASFARALVGAKDAGLRRWEGGLHGNLGLVHYQLGQVEQAVRHFESALDVASAIGDRQWAANARCNLGLVWLEQDEAEKARVHLETALGDARAMGQRLLEATVCCNLGLLELRQARLCEAQTALESAAALADAMEAPGLHAQARRALARALAGQGQTAQALRQSLHAAELAERAGDGAELARIVAERSALQRGLGDDSAADRDAVEAAGLAQRAGDAALEAEVQRLVAGFR